MFKSISFAVFAVAIGSAHAANFDKEETTMATEKKAFDSSFTSELTAIPTDLVYRVREHSKDATNFEAFNKSTIAKELSAQ